METLGSEPVSVMEDQRDSVSPTLAVVKPEGALEAEHETHLQRRRISAIRALCDYGRALATKRRRVDWTSNARVTVRSISMKPPRGRWCLIVYDCL